MDWATWINTIVGIIGIVVGIIGWNSLKAATEINNKAKAGKHNLNRDEMFYLFPRGCCGPASEVLACWLPRQGEDDRYEYVHGWRNDEGHTWLEYNGLIIDITADQFPEITEKVIVTSDRSFHNQFEEDLRYVIPKNSSIYSINVLLDFLRKTI